MLLLLNFVHLFLFNICYFIYFKYLFQFKYILFKFILFLLYFTINYLKYSLHSNLIAITFI